MRTKVFEKLPGEAPKVFLPVLEQEGSVPEPKTLEPEAKPAESASKTPAQMARAALKEAAEATKKAEIEAGMTVRDLIRILDWRGLISYDPRQNKYSCWVCGVPFDSASQIKEHFANGVGVPAVDMDALVADAKRARSRAALDARVDRFLGDSGNGNGDEILVAGRCAQRTFYRTVLALCKGQAVKIVPKGKRAWNVANLVKSILDEVSVANADGGVRLSLSLLPKPKAQ
jgi:hypothetical protein